MKGYQVTLFTLLFTSVLFSCKRDDDVAPEKEDTFKVVVTNEGGIQNFTQQMFFIAEGADADDVQIAGPEWDEVYDSEIEGTESSRRIFIKEEAVPSAAVYETNVDMRSIRYSSIIQAKEENGATMRTKIAFYHAGELIGEKVYDIEGKGSEISITFHKDYNFFDQDIQQPL